MIYILFLVFSIISLCSSVKKRKDFLSIFFDFVFVLIPIIAFGLAVNENQYFNKQYNYKETITINSHETYTFNNDTNKLYTLKKENNILKLLLLMDGEDIGTVEDHSSYTYGNRSPFKAKIKVYKSIKDADKADRDILNDLKND